ncbi:IQ domain-containing protein C [Manis javanica]|nr:IQ domain-containing protein C [Manis javanica]
MCQEHKAQAYERAGSQPSPPLEDQSLRNKTSGEPDQADDSCWMLKLQPHKSPERLATPEKIKYRDPCYKRTGQQLHTPSDNQTTEKRLTKEPDHGEQTSREICMQLTELLEDHTPKGLKPRLGATILERP